MTLRVRFDMSEFIRDSKKALQYDYPDAIIKGLNSVTEKVQSFERANANIQFHLRTQWIPNQIMRYPNTSAQEYRMRKDITTRHEVFASVFSSKHIHWMSVHEDGDVIAPYKGAHAHDKGKSLAIPLNTMNRAMKTSTGATKAMYEPTRLLENSTNPWVRGSKHPGERGTGRRLPFILRGRNGKAFIARRLRSKKTRSLELLYHFAPQAKMKQTWKFEERGRTYAEMIIYREMEKAVGAFTQSTQVF